MWITCNQNEKYVIDLYINKLPNYRHYKTDRDRQSVVFKGIFVYDQTPELASSSTFINSLALLIIKVDDDQILNMKNNNNSFKFGRLCLLPSLIYIRCF
jgi:hypothetical protein